jgi:hypothetical protein
MFSADSSANVLGLWETGFARYYFMLLPESLKEKLRCRVWEVLSAITAIAMRFPIMKPLVSHPSFGQVFDELSQHFTGWMKLTMSRGNSCLNFYMMNYQRLL